MKALKKLIFWGLVCGAVYFFMSTHVVFVGSTPKLLKKSKLTLDYTFFSTQGKSNLSILTVDELRDAGIGRLLLAMGRISASELETLTEKLEDAKRSGK